MSTELALLADLRSRGIDIETDGRRLRWRPAFLVNGRELLLIELNRAGLIQALLNGQPLPRCRTCGWTLDSHRRCSHCFDRQCTRCERLTGSYFIQLCYQCAAQDET